MWKQSSPIELRKGLEILHQSPEKSSRSNRYDVVRNLQYRPFRCLLFKSHISPASRQFLGYNWHGSPVSLRSKHKSKEMEDLSKSSLNFFADQQLCSADILSPLEVIIIIIIFISLSPFGFKWIFIFSTGSSENRSFSNQFSQDLELSWSRDLWSPSGKIYTISLFLLIKKMKNKLASNFALWSDFILLLKIQIQ